MPELEKISRKGIGLKVQPVSHPSVGKEVTESHTLESRLTKLDILDSANTARVDGQRGLSSLEPALGWDLLGSRTFTQSLRYSSLSLSSLCRTHNTKDKTLERAPFHYDFRHMKIMKRYYRLRIPCSSCTILLGERLVPYTYKSSIETHNTGTFLLLFVIL